ncbi:MAG: hypothetical protein AAGF83_16805 [Cyanobacteria bacterium P01_G01_bin.67]
MITLLIDSNWNPSLAQNPSNSGWGIVINPKPDEYSEFAVNIRENAPRISPFGFKLGEKICSVISGTEFSYSEVIRTLNDQIWYKVKIDNPLEFQSSSCPQPLQGWLIAEQSDGTRLVDEFKTGTVVQAAELSSNNNVAQAPLKDLETIEPPVVEPQGQSRTQAPARILPLTKSNSNTPYLDVRPEQRKTETESNSPQVTELKKVSKGEEEDDKWTTFSNYLLVCLGSILGLLVITFEQASNNDDLDAIEIITTFRNKVMSPIFLIRLSVLIIASFSFISILGGIEQKDNLLNAIQKLSNQGFYEPVIAGFLICIVILSFTSSSK